MFRSSDRQSGIDALKGKLFDSIVMHFGKDNGVPMMMAGADTVLEEIELAVERLLICPSASTAELSPEVSAMAEMWRTLDRTTRSERVPPRRLPSVPYAMPMAV